MLLTIHNMEVKYGKFTALNINQKIEIENGERIGVIGSNGAGKSTLVKAVLGITPYKGSISTSLKYTDMAVHLQENAYAATMAVKHIMEGLLDTKISKNDKLKELIDYFEFEGCLSKKYKALSGGQKQRMTIIMVLMQDAPLTFYDEVTSGLDFETRQRLMEKLADWYRDKDNSLMIVSHYYEELQQLVDKILILDKGKVVAYGKKEDLFKEYCGISVIIIDNIEKNAGIVDKFEKIESPEHLIALKCTNKNSESEVVSTLIENDINFKRSNNDIEIMSINAKKKFYQNLEEENRCISSGIYVRSDFKSGNV